ncbi:MAG: UDP-N-acetylmuramoyl-L-alanine--D-glutamate ligase [Candidatus Paceibacterota bacterium]|jgi:UDP-N-acetylmuramoylalanine--D-glutamate ligase
MDATGYFRGKKITLMRLGLLGRGVQDAAYLAKCGAEVLVVDDAPQEVMQPSVDALKQFPNITYKFGPYDLDDFRHCDMVVKGAGAALHAPEIAEAKKHGIPVRMSADLFADFAGIPIVGITGTRGKSSVTHFVHAILEAAGKKVLLGGNVRGVSTLALLEEATPDHVAVLELDSWQLQGFGEARLSPHIAVFTTLYPDHQNYYKESPEQYLADKANIFLYQGSQDTLVLGRQCAPIIIEKYGDTIDSKTLVVDELKLPDTWTLKIPGVHNRYNAALAFAAARALGVDDAISRKAITSFVGVPGRLELVREVGGIKIYNDTTATTPEATLVALRALDTGAKNIVLIMGGADKDLDMNALLYEIPNHVKRTILLTGTGTNRILEFLPDASVFDTLKNAVVEAFASATDGDIILFSPAFASFGMFKNEYDRGDQFNALVQSLSR